jgi:copper chaperone CopZ
MTTAVHLPARSLSFPVVGMTCASCVSRVERALRSIPGILDASVDLATESASIVPGPAFAAGSLAPTVRDAVGKAGYEVGETTIQLGIEA